MSGGHLRCVKASILNCKQTFNNLLSEERVSNARRASEAESGTLVQRSEQLVIIACVLAVLGTFKIQQRMLSLPPRCPSSTLLPFFFWGSVIKTE